MSLRNFVLGFTMVVTPLLSQAKNLVVCTESNPEGFDVVQYNSLITTNASADVLFNRLVEYDAVNSKVVPGLAERWENDADGLGYTFYLRRNLAFHSTDYFKPSRPLNADDVVFSFGRMLNADHPWHKIAAQGYPHAQSMQLPKLIKSIRKLDERTVRFELNYPEATLLSKLTMGFASIYSAEYAAQLLAAGKPEQLNSKPVGTGPFVFQSYQKDAVVRYEANPGYFGAKPKVDRLIYAITPDSAVRVQKLKAGECQIALGPKPADVIAARSDKAIKEIENASFMTGFLAINTQHKPLDSQAVRQAINLAFDKKTYLKVIFEGTAIAANRPYPPNTWSWNKDLPEYAFDPARARKLLADAGYPSGFDTTIWVRPTGSTLNPNPKAGAELLQSDLAKIGIRAQIKVIEWAELIRRAKAGEHDLLFMGWAGDNGDPDDFLTPQFSCAAVQSGTNFARFCDPHLDKLITEGLRTADIGARTSRYQAAQKIIHEQALWLPLAHPTASALTRENISGYRVSPFGRQDFSSVIVN